MNPDSDAGSVVARTADHVRRACEHEGSGHDWWHIARVRRLACRIGRAEKADLLIVELASLLHDIADWKFHGGDLTAGAVMTREWLASMKLDPAVVEPVCEIVAGISFKGAEVATPELTLEGCVVQDADRLDAIGAIGIARAFAYGGHRGRVLHDPDLAPQRHRTAQSYLDSRGTTVNHFYEKLLLLKDRMHTPTARRMAEKRHAYMLSFLERFYAEWEGGL